MLSIIVYTASYQTYLGMIKKIDISRFGQFINYSWSNMIGNDVVFKKLNIIYGRNYSGKTTLSRIFRCFEKEEMHKNYCDGNFKLHMEDGRVITNQEIDSGDFDINFRVYNSDFVAEHLSWLHREDGTIEPFTILGKANVEIENKIKDINTKLGSVESASGLYFELDQYSSQVQEKTNQLNTKRKALDKELEDKARDIKNKSSLFEKPVYHTTHIKTDIKNVTDSDILSDQLKDLKKELLREVPKPTLQRLPEAKPHFEQYYKQVKELVEKRIAPSTPIQELVNNALLQTWVRAGMDHHRDSRIECAFCGNPLPDDLWEKLDAHFNEASEELGNEIEQMIAILDSAKQSLSGYLIFKRDHFYTFLQSGFDELITKWEETATIYQNNVEELIHYLKIRKDDIFNVVALREIKDVSEDVINLFQAFNQLAEENNQKTSTLSADQEKAREELRLSEVAEFVKLIKYAKAKSENENLETEIAGMREEERKKKQAIELLEENKRILEAETQDEKRAAELINNYLQHFFGHEELKLIAVEEGENMRFQIKRGDEFAQNLSEGECSLISFCYFIAKLKDELTTDPANLYIYIDDPISSLDSNHVFFVFSLIENVIAREKKYTQLFISTHNLDFLKYIKRLSKPGKKQTEFFIMQKRSKQLTSLIAAPPYLKEYTTEFNYLFGEIHACTIENEDKHHYSFSNNLRKFLEGYLFFKYPDHNLSLEDRINQFFDGDVLLTSLVNRVINEYSHLEEQFDRGVVPIDLAEIQKIARTVLEHIHRKDTAQYEALCKSLEINPALTWLPGPAGAELVAN